MDIHTPLPPLSPGGRSGLGVRVTHARAPRVPAKKQEPGKPKDADAEGGEPAPAARLADALRDARVKVQAGFKVPYPRRPPGSPAARMELVCWTAR
jgi:hypothetical protein